jgi:hypothetical protein
VKPSRTGIEDAATIVSGAAPIVRGRLRVNFDPVVAAVDSLRSALSEARAVRLTNPQSLDARREAAIKRVAVTDGQLHRAIALHKRKPPHGGVQRPFSWALREIKLQRPSTA